jgi:hypothetical protein
VAFSAGQRGVFGAKQGYFARQRLDGAILKPLRRFQSEGSGAVNTNPPPGWRPRSGFEEAIDRIEDELRHAVAYVNDSVVPQVRRESIAVMRRLSDTLRHLADSFEASGNRQSSPSGPERNPPQNPSEPNPFNRDPRA